MPSVSHGLKRIAFPLVGLSAVSNLAVLVTPIFMMQVLDRVVPSGNLNTLVLLLGLALVAIALQSVVDFLRDLTLRRAANWVEKEVLPTTVELASDRRGEAIPAIADVSNFLKGSAAAAAINLVWLPIFFLTLLLVHPYMAGLAVVITFAFMLIDRMRAILLHAGLRQAAVLSASEQKTLENARKVEASADLPHVSCNLFSSYIRQQTNRHNLVDGIIPLQAGLAAASNWIRTCTQILGLSLGAALVVSETLSVGGMVAASIILSKTVIMSEAGLNAWPEIKSGLAGLARLAGFEGAPPRSLTKVSELDGRLLCRDVTVSRGTGKAHRLARINLELEPGQCCVLIGPSGSGKTTLLKVLAGLAPYQIGSVLLDETEVSTLSASCLAQNVGYLPQNPILLDGTLAENISSFDEARDDTRVLAAAKAAGVHGLISALPDSYDTDLSKNLHVLSVGQMQRVALARAIYCEPKFLFLDEPNTMLDAAGERQLIAVLSQLKKSGVTIVMSLHRSGLMGIADWVMSLDGGRVVDFGARAEVLARANSGRFRLEVPLLSSSLKDVTDWVQAQFGRQGDDALAWQAQLVASELFNLALQSENTQGKACFHFKFLSSDTCELILSAPGAAPNQAKMAKIASLLRHPEVDMRDLGKDEISLAMLSQLGTQFDIEPSGDRSTFTVAFSAETPRNLAGEVRH